MPNLSMHFTLVERRFYNNGSNKGVQGFYSKPTTNSVATADVLAAYDAKGSPPAELQVSNSCHGVS